MHEKCGTVLGLSLLIFWYHLFILLRFTFFLSLFPLSNYAANFTIIFKCATSHECRIFSRYISLELFYFKIIIIKKHAMKQEHSYFSLPKPYINHTNTTELLVFHCSRRPPLVGSKLFMSLTFCPSILARFFNQR